MGRSIFNQDLPQMIAYFGVPTHPEVDGSIPPNPSKAPIKLTFPTTALRQKFPDCPPDSTLAITFVEGLVQRITIHPNFPFDRLFECLFQYLPSTNIKVSQSRIEGGATEITCMGDGVGITLEMGQYDRVTIDYSENFTPPYNLLEEQQYFLNPVNSWNMIDLQNHDYPWLSERLATVADIADADVMNLYVMHHAIYAHKGLIFYNGFLREVFRRQAWYRPQYETAQFKQQILPTLSAIAQANLKFLWQHFLAQQPTQ